MSDHKDTYQEKRKSLICELLAQQRQYLETFFSKVSSIELEQVLSQILHCKGTIILSGVGKSGYIAEKIAATFLSIGVKAFFLDPVHAAHGHLGFLSEDDLFLAFSKSGESSELLEIIPHVKKKEVHCIGVISTLPSQLQKMCNQWVFLPVERELCPFDLAPTISTTVQLLFGDCLASALMRIKQMPLCEYAENHPGGWIGKRVALKVRDLMLRGNELPLCNSQQRLLEVLHELSNKRCGCLLAVDENNILQGIFTDGDLRRLIDEKGPEGLLEPVFEGMNSSARFTTPDHLAWEAMHQMEEDPSQCITVLPVLEGNVLVGLLRMHDILQAGLYRQVAAVLPQPSFFSREEQEISVLKDRDESAPFI